MLQTDLMGKKNFILFRNYTNLLNDKIFLKALKNNAMLVLGSLAAHLPLALLFGTFIFNKIRGSRFYQSVFFLPSVICGAGVGLLFNMIYNSEFGLVNTFLDLIRLSGLKHAWLSEEKTVMMALVVVVMWKYVGYHMVIQLAAMKSIPYSLYEAARIDGATKWQQIKFITLPLLKPTIIMLTTLSMGNIFRSDFGLFYQVPRNQGLLYAATDTIDTYVFRALLQNGNIGLSSAAAFYQSIVCLITILVFNGIIRRVSKENALF